MTSERTLASLAMMFGLMTAMFFFAFWLFLVVLGLDLVTYT